MKVVLNSTTDLFPTFMKISKHLKDGVEHIDAKTEKMLFDSIVAGDVSAFIIENSNSYSQKAIDFIKKKHPYILVIVFGKKEIEKINNADIYLPSLENINEFYSLVIKNILSYEKNFITLKRLTTIIKTKVEFGSCVYDPNQRILFHNGLEVAKFSEKAGGIIEVLSSNYGKLVKKDLILEKVWLKSDYFKGRSMDVYVTNIRKIFKDNNINMKIENISKSGLILK
jgi:DNA-binding winged helix-turn-helix (wHTH) protein